VLAAAEGAIGYPNPANVTTTALTAHNPANTLSATLQAFERYGVSRILAEPTVSAVSGEKREAHRRRRNTNSGSVNLRTKHRLHRRRRHLPALRRHFGILSGGSVRGRILLRLATEVTEIDNTTGQPVFGTFVPGLLTRKNETTVEIPSGGSIASAGLLQTISKQTINGLPGLLNLPILGALFRSNDYQKQETELMIIVTPYIVKPAKPGEIAQPTDGFADASDPQAWPLGRVNQLYATPGNPEAIKDYKGPVGFIQD
jgi:pilus assembly protein CpaC